MKQTNTTLTTYLQSAHGLRLQVIALLIRLAGDPRFVSAVAGLAYRRWAVVAALNNADSKHIVVCDNSTEIRVTLVIQGNRCRGHTERLYIPLVVLQGDKLLVKWLKVYCDEAESAAINHLVCDEVRARHHQRAMDRLPESRRSAVIRAANKADKKAGRKK